MKDKQIFLIFVSVLIFIFSISAVSAVDDSIIEDSVLNDTSDTNNNTILSQDAVFNDEISVIYVDGSQSVDGDGGLTTPFNNIKSALNVASEGSTIVVKSGTYSGENNVGLTISNSSLTIKADDGATVVFNGDNTYQIFTIAKNANSVSLINLSFVQGYGSKGGAINWKGQYGFISDCVFISNNASYGGGVYFTDNAKSEVIVNCRFINNTARYRAGGAVYFEDGNGKNTIKDSNFTGNVAVRNGGAIYWDDDSGDNSISNCIFSSNSVTADSSFGGAIHYVCDDLTIDDCVFVNNTGSYGGAVYVNGYDSVINNCNFTGNVAIVAGGLYIAGRGINVNDSIFTGNVAKNGSAIYNTVNSSITGTSFVDNKADSTSLVVFKNNNQYVVTLLGGDNILNAIYNNGNVSRISIDGVNPVDGAENSLNGELLYQDSRISGESITFKFYDGSNLLNTYTGVTDVLGNVYASVSGNSLIVNHSESNLYTELSTTYTTGNSYTDLLNLINSYILNGVKDIELTQSYSYNSVSDTSFPETGIVISESVNINGNGFTLNGNNLVRLFDVEADNVNISNLNIINHLSSNNGGAIYWNGANGKITNTNFTNNKANGTFGSGGAVFFNKANNNIVDSTFTRNEASLGAAVYVNNENITIRNSNFINNNGNSSGGAIFWNGNNGNINSNIFTSNNANSFGGAVFISGDNININSNTFNNNNVSSYGGAIYTSSKNGVLYNNIFNSNNAGVHGGAVFINANTTVSGNTQDNANSEYMYISGGNVSTLKVTVLNHDIVNQGNNVYINVTVTDDNNNPISGGSVKLNMNGQTYTTGQVTNGTARYLYFAGDAGTFTIVPTYSNSGNTVTSSNGQLTVLSVFYMVIKTNGTYTTGSAVTVNVNIYDPNSASPSGLVTLYLNETSYGTTNAVNGNATFNINLPNTAGTYTLTTVYNDGSGNKSTSRNLVVSSGNPSPPGPPGPDDRGNITPGGRIGTNIVVYNLTQVETLSNGGNVTGILRDSNGNPLSGQHVTLNLTRVSSGASKLYDATTDYNGEFRLQINLAAGDYTVKASYAGMNNGPMSSYSSSVSNTAIVTVTKSNAILNVNDYTSPYAGDGVLNKNFTGTLTYINGTPIIGRHLSLTLTRLSSGASKTYDTVTDFRGLFILQISLAPGDYTVTSTFSEDGIGTVTKTTNLIITRV